MVAVSARNQQGGLTTFYSLQHYDEIRTPAARAESAEATCWNLLKLSKLGVGPQHDGVSCFSLHALATAEALLPTILWTFCAASMRLLSEKSLEDATFARAQAVIPLNERCFQFGARCS